MTHLTRKKLIKKYSSGFTLIELMIVVAIVGILASISYPSYTKYVQKSKRTDAMVKVMQIAQQQEKFYSQNLKYAFNEETLFGLAAGTAVNSENDLYSMDVVGVCKNTSGTVITCTAATACAAYTVTATAKASGSQTHDTNCKIFSLTNVGVKTSTDSSSSASTGCW